MKTTLEIRVLAANSVAKVARFTMRKGKPPLAVVSVPAPGRQDARALFLRGTCKLATMRQLSSLDAQFLAVESARIYGHVAFLGIYEGRARPAPRCSSCWRTACTCCRR